MLNSSKTIGYKPKKTTRFALPATGSLPVNEALDRLTDMGGIETIYVDGNNPNPGDGSLLNPFKDLDNAYDKALGNGTIDNPEYAYGMIVVAGCANTYSYSKNLALNNVTWYFHEGTKIHQSETGYGNLYIWDTSVFAAQQTTNVVVLGHCSFRMGGAGHQRGIVRAVGTADNNEGDYYRRVVFQCKRVSGTITPELDDAAMFLVKNEGAGYNAHRNALELYVSEELANSMGHSINVMDRGSLKMVGGKMIGGHYGGTTSERVTRCVRATRAQSLVFENVEFYGQYQEAMIELGTADFATSKFRNIVFRNCSVSSRSIPGTPLLQADTAFKINNIDISLDGATTTNTTLPNRFLIDKLHLSGFFNNENVIDYTGTADFTKLELTDCNIKGFVHPLIKVGSKLNHFNGRANIAELKAFENEDYAIYDGLLGKGDLYYDQRFNAIRAVGVELPLPYGIGFPNRDRSNMATHGLLYTLEKAQELAPPGWRLPTGSDFAQASTDLPATVTVYPGYYRPSRNQAYYFGIEADFLGTDIVATFDPELPGQMGMDFPFPTYSYSVRYIKDDDGSADVETLQYLHDKEYRVKKLAGGKIWMLDNFAHEGISLDPPHKQGTDQYLDFGGPNQVSAADLKGLTQGAVTIGSGFINEFETARANKQLVPGIKYKVSGFLLEAVESDKISPEALYIARHPDYMNRTGNFIGVWRSDMPGIAVGKLVAYGTFQFRNKTGVNGTSAPPSDNTNWEYAHDTLQYTVLKTNVYINPSNPRVTVTRIEDPLGNIFSFKLLNDCNESTIYGVWQWGNNRFINNRIIECRNIDDFANVPHDSYIEGCEFVGFQFNTNTKMQNVRLENSRISGGPLSSNNIVKLHIVNSAVSINYCTNKNPLDLTITNCNGVALGANANSLVQELTNVYMDRLEKRIFKFNGTGSVVVTEKFYGVHSWYKFTKLNGIDSFVAEVWDWFGGVWKPYTGKSSVFGVGEWSLRITAQASEPSEIHMDYCNDVQPNNHIN